MAIYYYRHRRFDPFTSIILHESLTVWAASVQSDHRPHDHDQAKMKRITEANRDLLIDVADAQKEILRLRGELGHSSPATS